MKSQRLRAFDRKRMQGCSGLIGIDEAGRGALAGPVVAGAVLADAAFYESDWCRRNASSINDSKQLTPEQRVAMRDKLLWLESNSRIVLGIGYGSVEEIESLNILGATQIAMRRALEMVFARAGISPHEPDPLFMLGEERDSMAGGDRQWLSSWRVLVDGKPMKALGYPHGAIVQGDAKSLCIAMASIVAKVARDEAMRALDWQFPGYELAASKGYGTTPHRQAIMEKGATAIHRPLFLRKLLETRLDASQQEFGFD